MSKLLPHYSVCPLIDECSFLGIATDAEPDTVLVSASGNQIARYSLTTSKPLACWTTNKGTLTSAAVYDSKNERYVGVFNRNEIRFWTSDMENIDRVKKYKFADRIRQLFAVQDDVIILFTNGIAKSLDVAIESRKTQQTGLLHADEKINYAETMIVPDGVWIMLVLEDNRVIITGVNESHVLAERIVEATSVCALVDEGRPYVMTLRADNSLWQTSLYPGANNGEETMERELVRFEHLQPPVVLSALLSHYVAVYGMTGEGETELSVVSVKYRLAQCRQSYANATVRLWRAAGRLFTIIGHNLVAIPCADDERRLCTLLGAKRAADDDDQQSDSTTCVTLAAHFIQHNDVPGISNMLSTYVDIPDEVIGDLLQWAMDNENKRIVQTLVTKFSIQKLSVIKKALSVEASLRLLQFIQELSSKGCSKETGVSARLLGWMAGITDVFYAEYMCGDEKMVRTVMEEMSAHVATQLDVVAQYRQLDAALASLRSPIRTVDV